MDKKVQNSADREHFPAPFEEIASPKVRHVFIAALVFCFGIIITNIIRDNQIDLPNLPDWLNTLLHLKLVSNDAAFTLFTALLAGYLAYRQFALSQRPHLTYNGLRSSSVSFDRDSDKRYYVVLVRNGGGGPAKVQSATYRIALANGAKYEGEDYSEALQFLQSHSILEAEHFVLYRPSPGETVRAGGDWTVLEIDQAIALERIDAIDIAITVTSLVGGSYRREIFCIPRRWRLQREKRKSEPTVTPQSVLPTLPQATPSTAEEQSTAVEPHAAAKGSSGVGAA